MDQYQRTDVWADNTSAVDCVNVPPGYYSPAEDNEWHACSTPLALPPQLKTFTTRGDGTDDCAVSPQLQAFLPPAPDDPLAQPLRPPFTAEAWFEWGDTADVPVSVMGATPLWHLSLQLAASPTDLGTSVLIDTHLVEAARGAAVNASLPWVRRDEWHHLAAVCTDTSCCYFLDGTDFGCAPWSNRTTPTPEEPLLHTPEPAVFLGGTHGLQAAGFPPGFVHGKLAEVRLHSHALQPAQLGSRLSDLALETSCAEPDEVCGGQCVAGCAGDAELNASTCGCECARGESLDLASGRCVPPCGAGMATTSAGLCGCDASSFQVWRGRYLGISSPSTEPDFESHSWHHVADRIGLAEVSWRCCSPVQPCAALCNPWQRWNSRATPYHTSCQPRALPLPPLPVPPLPLPPLHRSGFSMQSCSRWRSMPVASSTLRGTARRTRRPIPARAGRSTTPKLPSSPGLPA